MARFRISTRKASKSYTDGVAFITVSFGVNYQAYNVREFEAKKLDEVIAEVKAQEEMAFEPSVTSIQKLEGRAPAGFNQWSEKTRFYDPSEAS